MLRTPSARQAASPEVGATPAPGGCTSPAPCGPAAGPRPRPRPRPSAGSRLSGHRTGNTRGRDTRPRERWSGRRWGGGREVTVSSRRAAARLGLVCTLWTLVVKGPTLVPTVTTLRTRLKRGLWEALPALRRCVLCCYVCGVSICASLRPVSVFSLPHPSPSGPPPPPHPRNWPRPTPSAGSSLPPPDGVPRAAFSAVKADSGAAHVARGAALSQTQKGPRSARQARSRRCRHPESEPAVAGLPFLASAHRGSPVPWASA